MRTAAELRGSAAVNRRIACRSLAETISHDRDYLPMKRIMRRTHFAMIFVLASVLPVLASVHPEGLSRHQRTEAHLVSPEAGPEAKSRSGEASLPTECRGYYVHAKSRREPISRCE
jgi:hypothetical protein